MFGQRRPAPGSMCRSHQDTSDNARVARILAGSPELRATSVITVVLPTARAAVPTFNIHRLTDPAQHPDFKCKCEYRGGGLLVNNQRARTVWRATGFSSVVNAYACVDFKCGKQQTKIKKIMRGGLLCDGEVGPRNLNMNFFRQTDIDH